MAGSIDDVETILLSRVLFICNIGLGPETGNSGSSNRNTALTLLFHPVSGGLTFVHFTNFVLGTRVEEHTFRRGGLTGVHVGDDTEVAHFLERIIALHSNEGVNKKAPRR